METGVTALANALSLQCEKTDPIQVRPVGQTYKNLNQQNNKMKKRIASTLLLAIMAIMAVDAIAQETEEHVRMEYILCSLNEGFTFQDVINNAK